MNQAFYYKGWIAAIGWICGLALFYQCFLYPTMHGLSQKFGIEIIPIDQPSLYVNLFSQISMAAMKIFEKQKGSVDG